MTRNPPRGGVAKTLPVAYLDIVQAGRRLEGVVYRTPVFTSRKADELAGAQVFFKCENFQRTGCSGFRGAYNAIKSLIETQPLPGVVVYSGGNHAQASALAAKMLGIPLIVIVATDAPVAKLAALTEYGARLLYYDRVVGDRNAVADRFVKDFGWFPLSPYDHKDVIAGQGTAAKELLEEVPSLDYLFVAIGGGGLIAGSAISAKALSPDCCIVGVEPATANDAQRSLALGELVKTHAISSTIADGARARSLGTLTWPIVRAYVDDIVTVDDVQLRKQVRFFCERMKMIVEPTGCLAACAVLNRLVDVRGKRVGVIVGGGNIDPNVLCSCIAASGDFAANGPTA
jgi:threo-3-hydroxy-L-aspartate ammonia-lyase